MLNKKRRWKTVLITSLAISLLVTSLTYAANVGTKKIQEAWYGTINIIYNGQNRTAEFEPFIVDGTSYVPLRTMSNIFNKNVEWNAYTNTATVTDKVTESVNSLKNQIIIKDIEISDLKRKIEDLESEIEDSRYKSLDDIEKDLNKEYGRFERMDFDISLRGDERNIDVRIETDLYDYRGRWDSLSTRNRKKYIEDICDDILYEYPNANIDGYIRDTDDRRDILTFYTTSRGDLIIDDDYRYYDDYYDVSLRDLEIDLEYIYEDYFRNEDIPYLEIELLGTTRSPEFRVGLDYSDYRSEWRNLSDRQLRIFMSDIYDYIDSEWRDADIEGLIYDTYNREDLATYYRTSNGSERFYRNKD